MPETYASATGIKRTACELLALENTPSTLRDIPYTEISAKKYMTQHKKVTQSPWKPSESRASSWEKPWLTW